jgi:hypothetical protein
MLFDPRAYAYEYPILHDFQMIFDISYIGIPVQLHEDDDDPEELSRLKTFDDTTNTEKR